MKTHLKSVIFALLVAVPSASFASILFEGWFEVFSDGKKVGMAAQRYEFINNKFKAITYLKTNAAGNNVEEIYKGESASDLSPIKYVHTTIVGKTSRIVDASFKGTTANIKIGEGKEIKKETKQFKKGAFLSNFLLYVILSQEKGGLKVGTSFGYSAFAEEEGKLYNGSTEVKGTDEVQGRKAFRVTNDFKDESFFVWVTEKGEFLLFRNPDKKIEVRFAETQAQAIKGIDVSVSDIKLIFNNKLPVDLPGGKPTSTDEEKQKKLFEKHDVKPSKQFGVPGGQGIMIKGAPAGEEPTPAQSPTKQE